MEKTILGSFLLSQEEKDEIKTGSQMITGSLYLIQIQTISREVSHIELHDKRICWRIQQYHQ